MNSKYGDGFWRLINRANSNALVTTVAGGSQAAPDPADTTEQFHREQRTLTNSSDFHGNYYV